MTKPDTLTSGATKAREIWLDVIEGRRFPLRHGYFCTRQPDDDERMNGITAEQARQAETTFFKNTSPWSRSTQQQRFGTNYLIASLSRLLSQVIDESYVSFHVSLFTLKEITYLPYILSVYRSFNPKSRPSSNPAPPDSAPFLPPSHLIRLPTF